MHLEHPGPALADLTTLRVGGHPRRFVATQTEDETIAAIREIDAAGQRLLLLGGGSNIVPADGDIDAVVVHQQDASLTSDVDACSGAFVTVGAGHDWDSFVVRCVEHGLVGVEALSGIPGHVGATPIQNVGAYGQEVSDTIARVRTYDRTTGQIVTHFATDCGFGYRTSRFKRERMPDGTPRWVVLSVSFQLALGPRSAPIRYAELADTLGVKVGDIAPLQQVRDAVMHLRRLKGMVLDIGDHDTWSVGSFFTNPILDPADAERLDASAPRWPMADGRIKTSAAWLVENAGFAKGFGLNPCATISTKHALALTNRGGARASDIRDLADHIQARVQACFGITLEVEPTLL